MEHIIQLGTTKQKTADIIGATVGLLNLDTECKEWIHQALKSSQVT